MIKDIKVGIAGMGGLEADGSFKAMLRKVFTDLEMLKGGAEARNTLSKLVEKEYADKIIKDAMDRFRNASTKEELDKALADSMKALDEVIVEARDKIKLDETTEALPNTLRDLMCEGCDKQDTCTKLGSKFEAKAEDNKEQEVIGMLTAEEIKEFADHRVIADTLQARKKEIDDSITAFGVESDKLDKRSDEFWEKLMTDRKLPEELFSINPLTNEIVKGKMELAKFQELLKEKDEKDLKEK